MDQVDIPDIAWLSDQRPDAPIVIVSFEGWNDAGDAATQAVRYLRQRTDSEPLATLDPEDYFDFTSTRPNVRIGPDGHREIEWPTIEFSMANLPGTGRAVVFVEGSEPQLRWRSFASRITDVATTLKASLVVTVGALLADVPHSRPVEVHGTTDNSHLADELHLETSTYQGPTGIVGVLASHSRLAGIPTASLWAAVPAYIPGAGSPKAALALIEHIQVLLDFGIDTTELEIAASAYERQVNELISDDDETAEYVADLEARYDSTDPNDESAEFLVAEVENFLRQQDN